MQAGKQIVAAIAAAIIVTTGLPVRAADGDITLLGSIMIPNSVHMTDVWGWVDPGTQREYAIIGDWNSYKVYIVDATDPANMFFAGEVAGVASFDLKVWDHYIYTCDGTSSGVDSWIIDIADPTNPVVGPNNFPSGHNLSISSTGILYIEHSGGLRTMDLGPDPLQPQELNFMGRSDGHDSTPVGNRLYDFAGALGTYIWDVSSPGSPVQLGHIDDPDIVYHHSGDATAGGTHLLINDELASHPTADITIWDITTPASPTKVAEIADPNSTVHNCYVIGDLAYVSYYASGFKVIDVSDPTAPVVVDQYDTSALAREGFVGAFGVYPYAPNNRVYVSDIDNGLFVFRVENSGAARAEESPATGSGFSLSQNAPNPFNPSTTIAWDLPAAGHVGLDIFSATGAHVRTLVDEVQSAGPHNRTWDGRDDAGTPLASGVYLYRLVHNGAASTRRMVLLK